MIRTLIALIVAAGGLAAMWLGIWGAIITDWMPSASPEDFAWRFTVGVLALLTVAGGLALIGFAGVVVAPVVTFLHRAATK